MIRINLLPYRENKKKAELRVLALVFLVSLAGVSALIVALEGWVVVRAKGLDTKIAEAEKEEQRLTQIRVEVDKFRAIEADLQQRLGVLNALRGSRKGPARFLDDLAVSTPERLWIEQFNESEVAPPPPPTPPADAQGQPVAPPPAPPPQRVFQVQGKTIDYRSIAEFMVNLKNTPSFEEVELEEVQEEQTDKKAKFLKFTLRGLIVPEKAT